MADRRTRAVVFPIKEQEANIKRLEEIIAASCEVVCERAVLADLERCLQEADVLVVLICPPTMNDPGLDALIVTASRAGKHVVGVWAPGTKVGTLPPSINRYGAATVTFDPKLVQEAVCGGKPTWLTPDGDPRPNPKTPRHKG